MPSIYVIPLLFLVAIILIKLMQCVPVRVMSGVNESRFSNLDGFRGVLAFLVYIHHSVIAYRYYFIDRMWVLPDDRILGLIGQFAVSGFFCLTGFLFWSKILNNGKIDVVDFFKGRIARVYPAYLSSVILLVFLVFVKSDFKLSVPLSDFFREIFSWLLLGTSGSPDINGVNQTGVLNAYVFWTLKYEFYFYLSLPLLSLFVRPVMFLLLVPLITLYYTWYTTDYVVIYFIIGAICSYSRKIKFVSIFCGGIGGGLSLLLFLANYFIKCDTAYSWYGILMSMPIMFIILNGGRLFNLLTNSCFRFLGEISYSLYLFHGMVIFIVFSLLGEYMGYVCLMVLTTISIIILSTISYLKVERPFIRYFNRAR
ncbi:acyltransferase [Plesiomonas shigelloides]|uniref:acyltransferase family protein n=1 Tax=Plesiomonas shigelloides TaxID=703 RepID=UPI003139442D